MKKMLMVLAVLAMTLPAVAGVVVSGNDDGGLTATISYDASSMSELVRAFALNISVDSGAVITDVNVVNADYNIYPGSIQIDAETGTVTDDGTAIADAAAYPNTDTLGGIGTAGVTVEMGSLQFVPQAAAVLVKVTVDKACTVTVAENAPRAGIVMEDPTVDAASNLPLTFAIAAEATVCVGDVDGNKYITKADIGALVTYLVNNASAPSWYVPSTDPNFNAACDIDGNTYVTKADIGALVTYLVNNASAPSWYVPCP